MTSNQQPAPTEDRVRFDGNFLDANDVRSAGDITLEISGVVPPNTEYDAKKKLINRRIVSFKGAKKRLILNTVNSKIIVQLHGDLAQEWVGKKITLTTRWLESAFGQRNVPVIRVVPNSEGDLTFGMRKNYGSPRPFGQEQQ